jgi:hypothetical protein
MCLAIGQVVFVSGGDGTEQELRKWVDEHTGRRGCSHTGAGVEATKRLQQHLLD